MAVFEKVEGDSYMGYGLTRNLADEVIAIDVLPYLCIGERNTRGKHTVYVDDFIMAINLQQMFTGRKDIEEVVRKKADQKKKGLETIVRAYTPSVTVSFLHEVCTDAFYYWLAKVQEEYAFNQKFRTFVCATIPASLQRHNLDTFAAYALYEVAIILSRTETKMGPFTEKQYDALCTFFTPEKRFYYISQGTPYITPSGFIEPYNVPNPTMRVLITDTPEIIAKKAQNIEKNHGIKQRQRFDEHLLTIFRTVYPHQDIELLDYEAFYEKIMLSIQKASI